MITRDDCLVLDAEDVLAPLRERFLVPDGIRYLDGNSLGALPVGVAERVRHLIVVEWGGDLIRSWSRHGWMDLPRTVGDRIARIVGAEVGSVVVGDSTTVNLFKVVGAALELRPERRIVLTDSGNFPTDLYVLQGMAATTGRDLEVRMVDPDEVEGAVDGSVAVVALTQVDYRTGRLHDLAAVTDAAHRAGAPIVWDLSHSAGALPVGLAEASADFAVGCGYKYLNGGPGAPAFTYVSPRHLARFRNPVPGWLGHERPFDFSLEFSAAPGIDRGRIGTPAMLSLAALDAALEVFEGVDLMAVRAKSRHLTGLFVDLVDQRLGGHGFEVATPRAPDRRGSQVSLRHPRAHPVVQALGERGVIGDFRSPDIARFGFAPLYLRFEDVWEAVDTLRQVMESGVWSDPRHAARGTVT